MVCFDFLCSENAEFILIQNQNTCEIEKHKIAVNFHRKMKKLKFKKKENKTQSVDKTIQSLQEKYNSVDVKKLDSFAEFPLSQPTLKALAENNYETPTEIQKDSIIFALQNKDILGAAKTGSGKTLAFLIPLLEKLFCLKWTPTDGLGALVITPTRELGKNSVEISGFSCHSDFT